ncbi:MAG: NADH-quinone oxidoreductase subunit L [Actinomycetota bacterium]
MSSVAWLIPALPAASAVVIVALGRRMPVGGAEIGILSLATAFVLSLALAVEVFGANIAATTSGAGEAFLHTARIELAPIGGGESLFAGIRVDGLTVMMFLLVTFVSLMVHVYSLGYLHGDERFTWYYAALSLFSVAMLLLVVADNLMLLLVGWELVGLSSFLLIGFWWEVKANSDAAIKAFLTTKLGDVGLVVGIVSLWGQFGTFDIGAIIAMVDEGVQAGGAPLETGMLSFALIAFILGVVGKSAQFPLHTWLPDAMAGPTPVSALIHAATMVTAGVFLVARLYPLYSASPAAKATLAVVGAITLLMAGLLAVVQEDIKKVLAYSTVSQLGYMVAALAFSYTAGIFHLFTHGFFKALLFLAAGSVIHAAHSNDLRDMGGLAKAMPTTFATFLIGTLALMAVPPLAGFWSKDEILVEAAAAGGYTGSLVVVLGALGGALTVLYMTRVLYLAFAGSFRGQGHPHESPRSMTGPLVALAVPAAVIGLANLPVEGFQPYAFSAWTMVSLEYWQTHPVAFEPTIAAVAVGLALVGFLAGRALYRRLPLGTDDPARRLGPASTVLAEKYYLDRLWTDLVTRTIVRDTAAPAVVTLNDEVIDRAVAGAGRSTVAAGRRVYDDVDQRGIDGLVHGLATSAWWSGARLRLSQSGNIQLYAGAMLTGVVVLAIVFAVGEVS